MLNVGSSRPFVQVSQTVPNDPTGRVQTVQYIDVGTVLTITPTINPDGYVNLQVHADGQQRDERGAVRRADHQQARSDDAGLHSRRTDDGDRRAGRQHAHRRTTCGHSVPEPHSAHRTAAVRPHDSRATTTSELFLFLTPHIISSDEDIDKLRDAVRDGSELLKQVNVGPHIVPHGRHAAAVPTRHGAQAGRFDEKSRIRSRRFAAVRPPPRDSTRLPTALEPIDAPAAERARWR